MGNLWQDLRYGARGLRKTPGFTVAVVLSLAIGIGANTSVFTIVNALLFKPLPAQRPEELAALYTSDYSGPLYGTSSYPDFLDFRAKTDAFSSLAAYAPRTVTATLGEQPEKIQGEMVSGNYFDVLGVRAARGRTFLPEEDNQSNANPVLVVSHDFWQRRFGADPNLVGKTLNLNNTSYTVIGVAAPEWKGMIRGLSADFWTPLAMEPRLFPGSDLLESRGARGLFVIGRLRSGQTPAQAQAQLNVLASQLKAAYAGQWTNVRKEGRTITLVPENESRIMPQLRGAVIGFTGLLMCVVALVLLVACANVAGLLLARATMRRKEIAIRLAMGASRWRLVRQMLTESLLLSVLGGALGVLLALWATDLLLKVKPPFSVQFALDFNPDLRVLGFTLLVVLLTGLAFGLAPALQATKTDLVPMLKDESSGGVYRRSRLRNALVVAQIALSLLLLIGSGLFLRSLANASAINPGFNTQNLLLMPVELQDFKAARGAAFYPQALERVRSLPGVRAASMTGEPPLQLGGSRRSASFEGYQPQPGEDGEVPFSIVGPDYFRTMETPLARGRDFSERDAQGAPGVAIINEALARRYFPGQDALGKHLSVTGEQGAQLEIIGIAKDGKYWTLGEDPRPFLFLPLLQNPEGATTLLVRTAGNPQDLINPVRAELRLLERNLVIDQTRTMTEQMNVVLLPVRVGGALLGLFGLIALILASVGVYSVVAYFVTQRTREFGVRIALGAQRGDILRLVIKQGLILVLLGIAFGIAGALALTQLLSSLLYGVSATDPITFIAVPLILVGITLAACYLPARRATKVNPMEALRYE